MFQKRCNTYANIIVPSDLSVCLMAYVFFSFNHVHLDLVKYIKKEHGDYFCISVAGYPEGISTK